MIRFHFCKFYTYKIKFHHIDLMKIYIQVVCIITNSVIKVFRFLFFLLLLPAGLLLSLLFYLPFTLRLFLTSNTNTTIIIIII